MDQIGQPAARVEQLAQRLNLVDDILGLKIFQIPEIKLHPEFRGVVGQLVIDFVGKSRLHTGQHLVKVVAVDVYKFAILELRQRLRRLAGKVTQNAEHEGQLFELDCPAHVDVIGNLDPRRAHAIQFVLRTFFFGHKNRLSFFQCVPNKIPGGPIFTVAYQARFTAKALKRQETRRTRAAKDSRVASTRDFFRDPALPGPAKF